MTLDPRQVGRRIKTARGRRGWTQLTFALEANVSPSSVSRWERGLLPPVRELMRLAAVLGVDPAELVEDHDEAEEAGIHARLDRIETLLEQLLQQNGNSPPRS